MSLFVITTHEHSTRNCAGETIVQHLRHYRNYFPLMRNNWPARRAGLTRGSSCLGGGKSCRKLSLLGSDSGDTRWNKAATPSVADEDRGGKSSVLLVQIRL